MNKKVGSRSLAQSIRRFGLGILVAIVLFSSSLSILGPSIARADAAADMTTANKKFYAGIFLRECLNRMDNLTRGKDMLRTLAKDPATMFAGTLTPGYIGNKDLEIKIGLTYKADSGTLKCSDGPTVAQALTDFGMYAQDFLLSTGYKLSTAKVQVPDDPSCGGSYCRGTHEEERETYSLQGGSLDFSYIDSRITQPLYQKYVAFLKIFSSRCQLTMPPAGDGEGVTYKKVEQSGDNFTATDVPAEFPILKTKVAGNGYSQPSTTVTTKIGDVKIANYDYDGRSTNCRDLLAELNGLIPAVVLYNNKNKSDPIDTTYTYTGGAQTGDPADPEGESTCTVDGVGWIVCPVMTFLAGINDVLYGFLANILDVDPTLFANNSTGGLYGAWNTFRSYANILFIIAFLIIVYSQITSVGITNYGVKKLLPKLIVAAILVNTSYYICQIAVDISNILGYGLRSLFGAIGGGLITSGDELSWASIVGAGLIAVGAAAGVAALMLAISVPVVLAGVLSLLMIAVILIARQSIIILLIAVSPLAFVAWLLPNTEKWFKKWWEIFFSMLMLFPIISALFGAGALAGRILATGDFGDDGGAAKVAALGATVLPLILTIPLLQNALKATGALGAKLSGWSQKANSRIGSKVKSDSKLGRGWNAAMSYRSQKRANKQTEAIATKKAYRGLAGVAGGKGYAGTLINRAKEAADKEHAEAVSRATSGFTGMKDDDILDVAQDTKRSAAERQAAISHLLQKGKHDHKVAALKASGTLGDDEDGKRARGAVSDEYARSDISSLYGKEVAGSIRTGSSEDGEIDMDGALRGNFGNVSAQTLANKNYAKSVAEAYAGADPAQQKKIDQAIDKIHSTPQIAGAITADTEAELMRIPHYAVAKAAAASGANAPAAGSTTTPPSTSGTGGSGGGSGGTSSGSGSPSGGGGTAAPTPPTPGVTPGASGTGSPPTGTTSPTATAPASTPGPLPGGGTTNLFSSGVAALPHSNSLVAPPGVAPAASTSSPSNLNNLENMSQVGDHEAPPTPRPSAPSDSNDDMDGVVPI